MSLLLLFGRSPVNATVSAPATSVGLATRAPSVSADAIWTSVPSDFTAVAGQVPTLSAGASISAPADAIAVADQAPIVSAGATVTAPADAIAVADQAPTSVSSDATSLAPALSIGVADQPPAVISGVVVTVPSASATVATLPPALAADASVAPSTTGASAASGSADIQAGTNPTAPAATIGFGAASENVSGSTQDAIVVAPSSTASSLAAQAAVSAEDRASGIIGRYIEIPVSDIRPIRKPKQITKPQPPRRVHASVAAPAASHCAGAAPGSLRLDTTLHAPATRTQAGASRSYVRAGCLLASPATSLSAAATQVLALQTDAAIGMAIRVPTLLSETMPALVPPWWTGEDEALLELVTDDELEALAV